MNLNDNPTKEQLRELLSGTNDLSGHHILWVDKAGVVRLTWLPKRWPPVEPLEDLPGLQMRVQTFEAGKGYVGEEAANDEDWVTELLDMLMTQWSASREKPGVALIMP
jgi:hypothetical protein